MGEVYRATDTNLKRAVAIKALPGTVASDANRLARFQREAEVLASLNHPNIAQVYGLEKSDGTTALVMELVEGPTLADRIAEGPLLIDEVLRVAKQIAEALEAAHERGIIHRDLKPANIKLRPDGAVKVLDFGLAKAMEPAGAMSSSHSLSPTITTPAMTQMGMILGTAAYMSPEQAKGRPADKRSDIWAFGCVLFEMLTGKRTFEGEDVSDTLASVLRGEPDWASLPTSTPAALRRLLTRCLEKDRNGRLADIADARLDLRDAAQRVPAQTSSADQPVQSRRLIAIAAACTMVSAMITAGIAWAVLRPVRPPTPQAVRFSMVPSAAAPLFRAGSDRDVAISPDGSYIVYRSGVGQAGSGLMVRMLDRLDVQELMNGVITIAAPFISPDNRWIGFFASDGLKKIAWTGGTPITLCQFAGAPRGASWTTDGNIIFATTDLATGLLSVPAGGGDPKPLTNSDSNLLVDHIFPSVLPDGRGVLYTVRNVSTQSNEIAVLDLKTRQSKTLVRGGSAAEYIDTGHLVYVAGGTLRAVAFDLARLEVTGDPVPVVEQPGIRGVGVGNFAISKTGTLVYLPSDAHHEPPRSLVWVDRHGREEPLNAPPRAYSVPRLSPDGVRVALQITDQENDIWIWDSIRHTLTRLTFDPALDTLPVWTPDGSRIVFNSTRAGVQNLFRQAADGTGSVERLTTTGNPQFPFSITPDGGRLLLGEVAPSTAADVCQLVLTGEQKTEPLIQTSFAEYSPKISPDGRWVAYQSNESGQFQIYVRPFPAVDTGRWQLSTSGGTRPVWARNGRELFYLNASDLLTAVSIASRGSTLQAGNPTTVLDRAYYSGFNLGAYDVSLDGQRFLMIKEPPDANQQSTPVSIDVVLNWQEELKHRLSR
jgi:serine/threonine-protein kinase